VIVYIVCRRMVHLVEGSFDNGGGGVDMIIGNSKGN